jgi:hypothetical protein
MTYIKVDDDMADKIIRDGLLESYFSTEEMVERLEERQEEGEELKPYQQEDLDYNRKYLKALERVIKHFSVGGNFNIEAERLDYYERELNYERDSYSPGLTESEDEDEI